MPPGKGCSQPIALASRRGIGSRHVELSSVSRSWARRPLKPHPRPEPGQDVTAVRPGDRVVVPFQIYCGDCRSCQGGYATLRQSAAYRGWPCVVAFDTLFRLRRQIKHTTPIAPKPVPITAL